MKLDNRIDAFEGIVLTLTIYITFSLSWQFFGDPSKEVLKLLIIFDEISCILFLIDWFGRLKGSSNKKKFTLYNLPDLIASIPFLSMLGYFGYVKAIRLLRVFQIIRIFGGMNRLVFYLRTNKINAFKLLFSITFTLLIVLAPIVILSLEQDIGNIKTAEQALWWTYCTLSTIGYGDFYPVTSFGRILAVLVSAGGIGLFGLLSGLIIMALKEDKE